MFTLFFAYLLVGSFYLLLKITFKDFRESIIKPVNFFHVIRQKEYILNPTASK